MSEPRSLLLVGKVRPERKRSLTGMALAAELPLVAFEEATPALEWLEANDPGCLIVEPGAGRLDKVIAKLRSKRHLSHVPVFALVTAPDDLWIEQYFGWGGDDVVHVEAGATLLERLRAVPREAPKTHPQRHVVIGDPDKGRTEAMARVFGLAGFEVKSAIDRKSLEFFVKEHRPSVVLANSVLGEIPELIARARRDGSKSTWVVLAARRDLDTQQQALGATDGCAVMGAQVNPWQVLYRVNDLARTDGEERRSEVRRPFGSFVLFRAAGSDDDDIGIAYNLSSRGMFVRTYAPVLSDDVWLEWRIPQDKTRVRLEGRVVFRQVSLADPNRAASPLGFGVEFRDYLGGARKHLERALEMLDGGGRRSSAPSLAAAPTEATGTVVTPPTTAAAPAKAASTAAAAPATAAPTATAVSSTAVAPAKATATSAAGQAKSESVAPKAGTPIGAAVGGSLKSQSSANTKRESTPPPHGAGVANAALQRTSTPPASPSAGPKTSTAAAARIGSNTLTGKVVGVVKAPTPELNATSKAVAPVVAPPRPVGVPPRPNQPQRPTNPDAPKPALTAPNVASADISTLATTVNVGEPRIADVAASNAKERRLDTLREAMAFDDLVDNTDPDAARELLEEGPTSSEPTEVLPNPSSLFETVTDQKHPIFNLSDEAPTVVANTTKLGGAKSSLPSLSAEDAPPSSGVAEAFFNEEEHVTRQWHAEAGAAERAETLESEVLPPRRRGTIGIVIGAVTVAAALAGLGIWSRGAGKGESAPQGVTTPTPTVTAATEVKEERTSPISVASGSAGAAPSITSGGDTDAGGIPTARIDDGTPLENFPAVEESQTGNGRLLADRYGYLIVRFPEAAYLFANNIAIGATNWKIAIPCGEKVLRVGVGEKPVIWLSPEARVKIECRGTTRVIFDRLPGVVVPPGIPRPIAPGSMPARKAAGKPDGDAPDKATPASGSSTAMVAPKNETTPAPKPVEAEPGVVDTRE